jgi:hypothetical protein
MNIKQGHYAKSTALKNAIMRFENFDLLPSSAIMNLLFFIERSRHFELLQGKFPRHFKNMNIICKTSQQWNFTVVIFCSLSN